MVTRGWESLHRNEDHGDTRTMNFPPDTSGPPLTAARVAKRLGLADVHAAWLAKLEKIGPSAAMRVGDRPTLLASLGRLGLALEDAVEVLRTMPSAEHDPESWWLLDRAHNALARGLANKT